MWNFPNRSQSRISAHLYCIYIITYSQVSFVLPDEKLSGLQVSQVEELPDTQRPPQGGEGTQVIQVLFERPAPLGDRLRREVPAQLLSCRN